MKNVRIYKDDIRTHILRSLFFTDTAIMLIGTIVLGVVLYLIFVYGFHYFSWSYYLSALFVSVILFVTLITQKIDNQPIYKIVPRLLRLLTKSKKQRAPKIDSYFTDFSIQDDLLIRKDHLIKIYEVEPFDIALLNEQDRAHFFAKLKQAMHTLPSQIQIIVKKNQATTKDYSRHIFSLYETATEEKEPLIKRYVDELVSLVEHNRFTITRCYAVLSVPCQPKNIKSKESAIKKLDDIGNSFSSHLVQCNIQISPLSKDQITDLTKELLR